MAQDALNRWWWPSLMMFGPPDSPVATFDVSMRWKIKRFTNDRCAEVRLDHCAAGSLSWPDISDPELRHDDATGHWEFGAIDWDEFRRVLAGDGPCNRERLAARQRAHDDGAWCVRPHSPMRRSAQNRQRGLHSAEPATPLWEVFIRRAHRPRARHVGSVHAADATMALQAARDVYAARRGPYLGCAIGCDNRIGSGRQGHAVRTGSIEDLPPSDVLRSA